MVTRREDVLTPKGKEELKLTHYRASFRPPPKIVSREWLPRNVMMPEGTETGDLPFSLADFPHVDGVLDAFDDPSVRTVALQWGTRLGKTTTCLSLMGETAAEFPRNMIFASSTRDAAHRVVKSRLYPILECTSKVKNQLRPEVRRSQSEVLLDHCRIFVGWSGSKASLADVGAWFGIANEIDKWSTDVSDEADPLSLFLNRMKGFPTHKVILESTPTITGKSRIEHWLKKGRQHLRQVPCPNCGEYQVLVREQIIFDDSSSDVARETAHYKCIHCGEKIENHHRIPMLRAGVWCPVECRVNRSGEIVEPSLSPRSDIVGLGPLPSWYSLTESWGDFARQWVETEDKPRERQDVINSYCAETLELKRSKTTIEQLAERLCVDRMRGELPKWALWITVGVDKQGESGGYFVWCTIAHGPVDKCAILDWGIVNDEQELWDDVIRRSFQHPDGGVEILPSLTLIDSGFDTKTVYDFCRWTRDTKGFRGVIPCKGSGTDLAGLPYKVASLEGKKSNRKAAKYGSVLVHVNTDFWESDIQARFDDRMPGEPGSLELPKEAAADPGFLAELLNGVLEDSVDRRGNARLLWVKKNDQLPNDMRDAFKYGVCAGKAFLDDRGGSLPLRQSGTQAKGDGTSGSREGGRPWIPER